MDVNATIYLKVKVFFSRDDKLELVPTHGLVNEFNGLDLLNVVPWTE